MRSTHVFATLLLAASLLSGGCTRAAEPEQVAEPPAVSMSTMPPEQVRSLIATSFPIEVPVPEGTVRRGQAQGSDAWDYEVQVAAPLEQVDQWYQGAYRARNWQLLERVTEGERASLTFTKGAAQSRVDLSENDGATTAVVILGVGAPVLQTQ